MILSKYTGITGTILVCFFILFLLIVAISFYFINNQENDAILINIAGRQRMLSQKMTKELFLYILTHDKKLPEDIVETKKLFSNSLNALIYGGEVQQDLIGKKYETTTAAEGSALTQLKKVKDIWINFEKNFNIVLNNPENKRALHYVKNKNITLLKEMDQAVYLLQRDSESKVSSMLKIQIITLILGIIITIIFTFYAYHKKIEEKVKYLSLHDQLTGLYNRAFFKEEMKRLDSQRLLPLSIIMGDVNGLKIANDAFGHLAGDELLITVGNTIKNVCRKDDIVSRWGGDEFVLLLPDTSEQTAQKIIERIQNKFAKMEANPIKPSIAFGCATKTENERDIRDVLKTAEDRMYRNKMVESKSARSSIISSLEKTLLEKDYETEAHAQRLKKLASKFGKVIGLSNSELDELSLLAALHDIGKIALPDDILLKPGPLKEEEWKTIKKHPEIGYRIALCSDELTPIADYILAHHERWDGNGYPQGLKGEIIPLLSRIIAIVDSYDVMIHERPYKKAISKEEAKTELIKHAGKQFDAKLVKIFIGKIINDS